MKNKRKELSDIYGITDVLKVEPVKTIIEKPKPAPKPVKESFKTLDAIRESIGDCKRCRLHEKRTNIVFGEGNPNARLMFIGEAPGADEDKTGRPFVGRAGQLLTKMIEAMGLTREDVYIANIAKCRPPENRAPLKDESDICIGYLQAQIEVIKPQVIVCLGSSAIAYLLNSTEKITALRGNFQEYHNTLVMPTFHPAYLLRNVSKKREVWEDLKKVMKYLDENKEK